MFTGLTRTKNGDQIHRTPPVIYGYGHKYVAQLLEAVPHIAFKGVKSGPVSDSCLILTACQPVFKEVGVLWCRS